MLLPLLAPPLSSFGSVACAAPSQLLFPRPLLVRLPLLLPLRQIPEITTQLQDPATAVEGGGRGNLAQPHGVVSSPKYEKSVLLAAALG